MFTRNDGSESSASSTLPPQQEFLVSRVTHKLPSVLVKGHFCGISRGGVLGIYEWGHGINPESGQPAIVQFAKRMFKCWDDVEKIDIPDQPVKQ